MDGNDFLILLYLKGFIRLVAKDCNGVGRRYG